MQLDSYAKWRSLVAQHKAGNLPSCFHRRRRCPSGRDLTIHSSRSRFAARLNSGVRRMWKVFSLLVIGALLSACVAPTRSEQALEDFGEFFAKAQQDPRFRSERISTELAVT